LFHSVVFPINITKSHWFTVVACNVTRTLYLYDFYYQRGGGLDAYHGRVLALIEEFLDIITLANNNRRFTWKKEIVVNTQLQEDGHNCGPLLCFVAWMTARLGRPPTEAELRELKYEEKHKQLHNMRLWMAYSALTDRIWLPPVAENTTDIVRLVYGPEQGPDR
jgi:Ulp1 family protease